MNKKTEIKTFRDKEDNIEYFSFGNGKKDLIILPGLSIFPIKNSREYIVKRYELLTNEYRITIIDRPLYPKIDYDMALATNEIVEIIKLIGAKNVSIMGFSLGGMIAQMVAISYPEIIEKLILCATTSKVGKTTNNKISSWVSAAEKKDMAELAKLFVNDVYSQTTAKAIEANTRKMLSTITQELIDRFIILAKSSQNFNVQKEINTIKCKTLIMASKGDAIIPFSDIDYLSHNIKGSQLYIYNNNYGHAFIDEADDVVEKISTFLKSK